MLYLQVRILIVNAERSKKKKKQQQQQAKYKPVRFVVGMEGKGGGKKKKKKSLQHMVFPSGHPSKY